MAYPPISDEQLEDWFTYHPPLDADAVLKYQMIREAGKVLATVIRDSCPNSPDTTTAIRTVRESVMWANASIACGDG